MKAQGRAVSTGFGLMLAMLLPACSTTPQQLRQDLQLQQQLHSRYHCPQLEPQYPRPQGPPPYAVSQAERDGMAAMGNPCAATW